MVRHVGKGESRNHILLVRHVGEGESKDHIYWSGMLGKVSPGTPSTDLLVRHVGEGESRDHIGGDS